MNREEENKIKYRVSPQNHTDIDFLYGKCVDAPKYSLAFWISVPEFYNEISSIAKAGGDIDEAIVLDIMIKIYKAKDEERKRGVKPANFNFYSTRKSLRRLSEVLYGDKDFWQK